MGLFDMNIYLRLLFCISFLAFLIGSGFALAYINEHDLIKNTLKKWLLKDELKSLEFRINEFESIKTSIERATQYANGARIEYEEAKNLCTEAQRIVNSVVETGVDVGFHDKEHSWAVICVAGKPEYVKFIPLTGKEARDVLNFLKQFQYSNNMIDSPLGFKYMLKDMFIHN